LGLYDLDDCVLRSSFDNFQGIHINFGRSVIDRYPDDARFTLEEGQSGLRLYSFLPNTQRYLIVASAVRAVLEDFCKNSIEYLPFELYRPNGKLHTKDYCIVNPLGTVDGLNYEESQIEYYGKGKDREVIGIDRMVLSQKKLESAPHLFRLKEESSIHLVSEALLRRFKEEGFTKLYVNEVVIAD